MSFGRIGWSSIPVISLLSLSCGSTNESLGAPVAEQWSPLVDGEWSLEGGQEDPKWCKKIVLTDDIYVSAMRPIHPAGTHHTTLALVTDDGNATCAGATFGPGLIYAAGVGTEALRMPKGVAMKLPKGQALLLGLHIYNTTSNALAGRSAIEIVRMKPEDVKMEADMLLSGPASLSIPPSARTTISHTCQVVTEQNVFNLFPHMHQMGKHLKTTLTIAGQPSVIHDGDYDFEEQVQLPVGPYLLHAGDAITTECTYENDTNRIVGFGESSDTEMCFSILFRYPKGKSPLCAGATEGGGPGTGDGGTPINPGPCAAASDPGNDVGVGKFCAPSGGQCLTTGKAANLCLGDFIEGEFTNFCTMICASDAECGAGAFCGHDSTRICIPTKCVTDGGF